MIEVQRFCASILYANCAEVDIQAFAAEVRPIAHHLLWESCKLMAVIANIDAGRPCASLRYLLSAHERPCPSDDMQTNALMVVYSLIAWTM